MEFTASTVVQPGKAVHIWAYLVKGKYDVEREGQVVMCRAFCAVPSQVPNAITVPTSGTIKNVHSALTRGSTLRMKKLMQQ